MCLKDNNNNGSIKKCLHLLSGFLSRVLIKAEKLRRKKNNQAVDYNQTISYLIIVFQKVS